MAGLTYSQIAQALDYRDRRGAHNAVNRTLRRTGSDLATDYRRIELARTERLLTSVWPQALAGDLFAVDRVLKIIDRQCRLLGLDAPVAVTVSEGTKDELSRMMYDLERALIPGPDQEPDGNPAA